MSHWVQQDKPTFFSESAPIPIPLSLTVHGALDKVFISFLLRFANVLAQQPGTTKYICNILSVATFARTTNVFPRYQTRKQPNFYLKVITKTSNLELVECIYKLQFSSSTNSIVFVYTPGCIPYRITDESKSELILTCLDRPSVLTLKCKPRPGRIVNHS